MKDFCGKHLLLYTVLIIIRMRRDIEVNETAYAVMARRYLNELLGTATQATPISIYATGHFFVKQP